ncbi:unnamed protein product [Angiostrongylus costaricensis]|uniref:LRRCT domain-containing protein n=1 Tax=Angiostrongylus costaricensis TaxID=334426 RepID=A0A0R3PQ48_ANGCS|nr:unnamed protein product [Angiostrongylus costaricensis]
MGCSKIHERAFPYIDTLTMTGNNFGDISEGLFTEGEVHRSLSLMNLTGNSITKVSSLTFKSTPAVQFLYLNNNNIKQAGRYPFEPMKRLRLLDMTAALGRRPAESKADLISVLFETDMRGLVELAELKLAKNHIEKLHKDTFCKFSTTLWDSLESLSTLDISSNPLHCDCTLQPFVTLAKQEKYSFVNQGKTFCASPSNRVGKNLFELKEDLCQASSWGLGTFILLLVISAACKHYSRFDVLIFKGLFAYRYYRSRTPRRSGFQFGYSGLDCEDDTVRPEFV